MSIRFGEKMDVEKVFGPFRKRWRDLVSKAEQKRLRSQDPGHVSEGSLSKGRLGEVHDHELRYGAEAEQLRKDVTLVVREEVLRLRRSTGLPDEDPKCSLVETWQEEGSWEKSEGRMKDGSVVEDM